jgi:hypothetical protein
MSALAMMMRSLMPGDRGTERLYEDFICAIIFEPPVPISGAEGEAARRDRLLPTGHR